LYSDDKFDASTELNLKPSYNEGDWDNVNWS
jgi:hypothetical protein